MIIKGKNKSKISPEKNTATGSTNIVPAKKHEIMEKSELRKATIKERQERRRGDRRRGYRRLDDRNIISRAQEEANTIKKDAFQEGLERSTSFYKDEIEKLTEAINELLTAKEKVMRDAIPDIAIIAVKAAEKIIKKEVELSDKVILKIVSEIIQSVGRDETEIMIKTNAHDVQIVKENLPEIYPYHEKTKINVIADEEVERGSCIVETRNGIIDAKFSTQLQILEKALVSGM